MVWLPIDAIAFALIPYLENLFALEMIGKGFEL